PRDEGSVKSLLLRGEIGLAVEDLPRGRLDDIVRDPVDCFLPVHGPDVGAVARWTLVPVRPLIAGLAKSYACWITRRGCTLAWNPNQASPVATGGKRRHPRAHENTGIGADEPEA